VVVAREMLGGHGAYGLAAADVHADQRDEQQRVEDRAGLEHRVDHGRQAQQHRADRQAEDQIAPERLRERDPHVQSRGPGHQQQMHGEVGGRAAHHREKIDRPEPGAPQRPVRAQPRQDGRRGGERKGVLADVEADLPPRLARDAVLNERRGELRGQGGNESQPEQEREREHHRDRDLAVARPAWRLNREELADQHADGKRTELDELAGMLEIDGRPQDEWNE
jgi:hypothetical protein